MSADWVASYRLQLHAGFPLGRGSAGAALPGRVGNQSCVPLALPAGRFRAASMDTMSRTRRGSARIWAANRLGRISSDCAPLARAADPPRHRAEPHVRLAAQSVVGRRAGTRALQRVRRLLRFQDPAAPALPRASVFAGAALRSGRRGGRTQDRGRGRGARGCAITRIPGRWDPHPGVACCRRAKRLTASAAGCFANSSDCSWSRIPGEQDRIDLCKLRGAERRMFSRKQQRCRTAAGRASNRADGDKDQLDAVLRRQFYVLHGWKLAGELTNYRRFFDIGSLAGIRAELPHVFAATHARIEDDDRARARSTACESIIRTACGSRSSTSSGCARCCRRGGSMSRRFWRTTSA